jgi:predicted ATPase
VRIGRYELLRMLGHGGQGRVWEALLHGPAGLRKRVALKVLERGDGLAREARIGGLLRHPNLVDVYEVGEEGGKWYCAMELCAGGTLATRVPLPPRAVVDVGLQVCAALAYAHEELGLVHLDLKPHNLLISGRLVKVADLGLARARGFEEELRRGVGTRGFMSPEQLLGTTVDARSDVYSMGVVLAVLATGNLPGRSETFTIDAETTFSDAHLADAPPAAALLAGLGDLARVIERCVELDPDDRYPTMAAVAEALRRVDAAGPRLAELLDAADGEEAVPDVVTDAFVGRRAELDALSAALSEPGLVTLRGPAGIGKTRLARAAASSWSTAWFVPLADARTAPELVRAVAAALEVPLQGQSDAALVAMLGHALASRGDALLVLDNVEQLAGAAEVVTAWRAAAPRLRVLATGRQALRAEGERLQDVDVLDPIDAVALLRARALDRGVSLRDDPALRALAERLDGVPLAIELAAGRLGVLSPAEVLDRLGLSLLRSGRADLSDRQATLRGALDWSWDLLSEPERAGLAALSVFQGGFTLEAAEAVVAAEPGSPWVLDLVQALAEKSLVRRAGWRFDLLVAVREYAYERLAERGGTAAAEERHGAWFAARGAAGGFDELGNLVIATRRAVARGDGRIAAATLEAAGEVFRFRGPFRTARALAEEVLGLPGLDADSRRRALLVASRFATEAGDPATGAAWLREVLASDPTDAQRLVAMTGLGAALDNQGNPAAALEVLQEAIALARQAGDRAREGVATRVLALAIQNLGRTAEALELLHRALALHREVGSRYDEAQALGSIGGLERLRGGPDRARPWLQAALAMQGELRNRRAQGVLLWQLAAAERAAGDTDLAEKLFRESLAIHREVGNRRFEGTALSSLGNVATDRLHFADAIPLYEQALAIHRETGNRRDEGLVLGNLAFAAMELGRLDEARSRAHAALEVHKATRYRESEGVVLGYLGNLLEKEGRHEEALAVYADALTIHREVGNKRDEGKALQDVAGCLAALGHTGEARLAAQAALALHREVGNTRSQTTAEALLARLPGP